MSRSRRSITINEAHILRGLVERARVSVGESLVALSFLELLGRDGVEYADILGSARITDADVAALRARESFKAVVQLTYPTVEEYRSQGRSLPHHGVTPIIPSVLSKKSVSLAALASAAAEATSSLALNGSRATRAVVMMLGDDRERSVHEEIARLQDAIPTSHLRLYARTRTRLEDVQDLIDDLRPAILHLTAHSNLEGLHLCGADGRVIVAWEDFIREVERCHHRPDVVVLNSCSSLAWTDRFLELGVHYVISVDGAVAVDCALEHSAALYRSLGQYSLNRSIERAGTAIRVSWPRVAYAVHRHPNASPDWYAPWVLRA